MPALRHSLFLLLALLLAASACAPSPRTTWALEDLLLLDPLDAPSPSLDILALYARPSAAGWALRLDLLDLPRLTDYSLSILLATNLGQVTIHLPARGKPSLSPALPGWRVRLARNALLDTVTVRLTCPGLVTPFSLRAASFLPGDALPADETALVRSDAIPPLSRAPVLIAFSDVFPAYTPAQALRRWQGAHTGPVGGRHGLRYVLDAAETYRVPVTLLDLKTPGSLSALAFTGDALAQVRRMADAGLLILPDAAWSQPVEQALSLSRDTAVGFDLPASLFAWSPLPDLLPGYRFQFLPLPDASRLASQGGVRLIPLPSGDDPQVGQDGPTLQVRRALVEAALSPDPSDLVVLGGSLPASLWGAADSAAPTFAWLAAHPWVWLLGGYDLLSFPLGAQVELPAPAAPVADSWLPALQSAPGNALTRSAWQVYLMLHTPTADPALQSLRAVYAGQVGILLTAAAWAEIPVPRLDCSTDLDRDGAAECLLADDHYFAVFEMNGARLTHLFMLDESGPHQLVAPTTQFTIGLSDPSLWRPEVGDAADPAALVGAFSDKTGTYDLYQPSITDGVLTLVGAGRVKTFRLSEGALEAAYASSEPVTLRIPLAVDPQVFYAGYSTYQARLALGSWTWGLADGLQVEVLSDAQLAAQGFTTARVFLSLPEDPDRDYPAGQYYPFPLSLVTVRGEGEFTILIGGE